MANLRGRIPVIGCLSVTVKFKSTIVETESYIVKKGAAVVGRVFSFCLLYKCYWILYNLITTALVAFMLPVSKVSPLSDTSLGCAKKFVHNIKVQSAVKPFSEIETLALIQNRSCFQKLMYLTGYLLLC